MSTLAYAAFTTSREKAQPGTSGSTQPPGASAVVDALAALVPAEVLTLHALILTATTQTTGATTTITAEGTLYGAFWGLILLSAIIYLGARWRGGKLDRLDWIRMLIPALAFVGWTMLQRATAFDAFWPGFPDGTRTVIGLFLGVVLGLIAAALAFAADQKLPPL